MYRNDHDLLPTIQVFIDYFQSHHAAVNRPMVGERSIIYVNYEHLRRTVNSDEIEWRLKSQPANLLACMAVAADEASLRTANANDVDSRIVVRLTHYDDATPLKDLKANLMGKFISVRGTVVRVSSVKPIEKLADKQLDSGRVPRTVECELTEDLVDVAVPGDVVSVVGTVKVLATDEGKLKNKTTQMYFLYIDANCLVKASGSSSETESGGSGFTKDFVQFSTKELYGIREIHESPDVFRLLVNSLCPAIFGHDMVKAGLLLTLLGGRRRGDEEMNEVNIRSDPHVLVVGDPGLGKSQMLSATVKIAPRGVYVCGNTATTSGLTVTMCKDPETGDTALEAGALVLGDRGVCCIDEFDKMTEHQALLEAMEQQSVSIAKAGKAKTVSENLKMGSALLSRFDLVFILLDKPDEEMDMFLSDHIMKIADSLTPEAAHVLQKFYLTLRSKYRSADATPITTRQLESMIRLAEARARAELRDQVTQRDAEDVVEIMKFSLWDTYQDELGNLDFQRSQHGSGTSKKGQPKRFIAELHKIAQHTGNSRFTYENLYSISLEMRLRCDAFQDFVDSLNNQGYLLKKGHRIYQLSTVS
ncbi:DNA replication licensing factor mcm8 [Borealophlyctis nickersoniae]|nr:DNA replication licensing factor mcm8 [Borealophlyctis nickersoniae]